MPENINPNVVAEAWLSYRGQVIPSDASATQLLECRRAFYAGATGLLTAILSADGNITRSVEEELFEFVRNVRSGRA